MICSLLTDGPWLHKQLAISYIIMVKWKTFYAYKTLGCTEFVTVQTSLISNIFYNLLAIYGIVAMQLIPHTLHPLEKLISFKFRPVHLKPKPSRVRHPPPLKKD